MKIQKRSKLIATVLVMLAIGVLSSCGTKSEERTDSAVRVGTETIVPTKVLSTNNYVGEVSAEHATAISFPLGGLIQQMFIEEGQQVTKGQTLAIIDDTQMRNALAAAEAMFTQAKDAYDRMKVLHERGSLSDMDWVSVESKFASAKSNYNMAKKNVCDTKLTAPYTGIIGRKAVEAGTTVSPGQPICTILDICNVKVKVNVPEKDMGLINDIHYSDVQISIEALGGTTFDCTNIQRSVQGNPASRTYDIYFYAKNKDSRLLPGMVADIRLTKSDDRPCLLIPITAVQRRSQKELFVWVMRDGKAVCQKITTGQTNGGRVEVTSGLVQGDKIIVKGYQKLSENMQVTDK